ncbi:T9SS type A sorting domain-containing protein, partial [Candidatus Poribacteria bacterium]|nr:T9SS type A sorting domain-containing protein [Candidatus Poribacteria bacterium]
TGLLSGGNVKRDAWTARFSEVIGALNSPDTSVTPVIVRPVRPTPRGTVHIPDPNLRAVIIEALGKSPNTPITAEDIATLSEIDAADREISDLTGLEFAKNLIVLFLDINPLSDLSPLSALTKLRELYFSDTQVVDLSPLSGLHALEVIGAEATRIRSLAPLAGLKNLQKLNTVDSDITDLSPLAGLTNLTRLRLYDVKATDLSPLKGLTKLKWLGLTHTDNISNLLPLSGLTELKHLDLHNTDISDVSALAGLVNLETLILSENRIVDVSPLASLRNLKNLELHENNISDFSHLDDIRKNLTEFTWYRNPAFPQGGPKIAGPWQWLMLPVQAEGWGGIGLLTDYLKAASEGKVTEQQIATLGASAGDVVGDSVWSVGTLESYNFRDSGRNENNIRRLLDPQGAIEDHGDFHYPKQGLELVIYASITLYSPRTQQTRIFVGASLGRKVWLNGKLLHEEYIIDRGNHDYQNVFPATLKKGKNVVLVAGEYWHSRWSLFFGFEPGTEYTISNPSIGYTFSTPKIHAGDTFTLDLSAEDIYDFSGWQFDIAFDPAVLEAIEVNEGDFLKTGGGTTFFQKGKIDNRSGKITGLSSALLSEGGVTGTGTLLSVNFSAKAGGETQLKLQNVQFGASIGDLISAGPHEVTLVVAGQLAMGDVNRDGQVSILDIILIAQQLGKTVPPHSAVDVNGDGTVSILDIILVAQHLGESIAAAAPSILTMDDIHRLDPAMVQTWIAQAQIENDGSAAFREGIANLQRLLALLIPEETALLANYPNPFNPETWIPYQLSEPAEVTLRIYSVNGVLVRTLVLGHLPAGIYQSQSRAAYWDGRNDVGESVASGVYFYTLTAGDFTATRKMLIRK